MMTGRATGGSSARTCYRISSRRSSSTRPSSWPATSFEAALSFLGVGIKLPTASWGNLLSSAPEFYTSQPWLMLWPGLAVIFTTLAFNLLGDGLRDAFDPRSRL